MDYKNHFQIYSHHEDNLPYVDVFFSRANEEIVSFYYPVVMPDGRQTNLRTFIDSCLSKTLTEEENNINALLFLTDQVSKVASKALYNPKVEVLTVSERLQHLMTGANWQTYQEVAEFFDVSESVIQKWSEGELPDIKQLTSRMKHLNPYWLEFGNGILCLPPFGYEPRKNWM